MKNKVLTLIIAGILTIGGISVAYASTRADTTLNNFNRPMMGSQNSNLKSMMGAGSVSDKSNGMFNNMIQLMKVNGFNDQAKAMENRDFDAMNKFMASISDADYEKMMNLMQENGYRPMYNMMKSVGKDGMVNMHQGMMGR